MDRPELVLAGEIVRAAGKPFVVAPKVKGVARTSR